MELLKWAGVPRPERIVLDGLYTRLEPLDYARHGPDLFASARAPGADDRFRYLSDYVPVDLKAMTPWLKQAEGSIDPMFWAVIDRATGKAEGRQALMRIDTVHGVIEIGHIMWGPAIARTRVATEALYLVARYAFEALGYRRFEWKCNNFNEPSKRAALRFGFTFEGIFRQHMVAKGQNRDTAWFAVIDRDWSRLRTSYETWLRHENFDDCGQQRSKLTF